MENTREELKPFCSKDVEDIIMSYTYPKCIECEKLVEIKDTIYTYNDKYLCIECLGKGEYKLCNSCNKQFKKVDNIFCSSCNDTCVMYCSLCLNSQYRRDLRIVTGEHLMVVDSINDLILFLNY